MRSTLFLRSALGLRLLLGLGCSQSTGPAVTLDVAPDSLVLIRNSSVQLSVTALDGDGHLITGVAVSFASNDTAIATVTNVGVVRSLGSDICSGPLYRARYSGAARGARHDDSGQSYHTRRPAIRCRDLFDRCGLRDPRVGRPARPNELALTGLRVSGRGWFGTDRGGVQLYGDDRVCDEPVQSERWHR